MSAELLEPARVHEESRSGWPIVEVRAAKTSLTAGDGPRARV